MRNRREIVEGFRKVLNCESAENGSNTPDFILAEYLAVCLDAIDLAINAREEHYGREAPMAAPTCPNEEVQALRTQHLLDVERLNELRDKLAEQPPRRREEADDGKKE